MKITKIAEEDVKRIIAAREKEEINTRAVQRADENNIPIPTNFARVKHFLPNIKKVKFSGRATIVFWEDNTKTVVKDFERRDVEHDSKLQWSGLALAICKKMYGDDFKDLFYNITEGDKFVDSDGLKQEVTDIILAIISEFDGIFEDYDDREIIVLLYEVETKAKQLIYSLHSFNHHVKIYKWDNLARIEVNGLTPDQKECFNEMFAQLVYRKGLRNATRRSDESWIISR